MALSRIVVLVLLGLTVAAEQPVDDDGACSSEEGCHSWKGASMLQTGRAAPLDQETSDALDADLADADMYEEGLQLAFEDSAEKAGDSEEQLEESGDEVDDYEERPQEAGNVAKATECVCGDAKLDGDAVVEEWNTPCSKVVASKSIMKKCAKGSDSTFFKWLKSQCCEVSGACLCGKAKFQPDNRIGRAGHTCRSVVAHVCGEMDDGPVKKHVEGTCCGAPKGCGSELCPDGAELLSQKAYKTPKGKSATCGDVAWWFENRAPKTACGKMKAAAMPKCCKIESYGADTDAA